MKKIQLGGHKKGSEIKGYALVDDKDFEWLNRWKWSYSCGYATYKSYNKLNNIIERLFISMHNFIMQTPQGMDTDHINGNKLDNQRSNLRICTHFQNGKNRKLNKNNKSGYKGVSWNKKANKWEAGVKYNYKRIYLGQFENKIEAAKIYNRKVIKLFGGFAQLNKI